MTDDPVRYEIDGHVATVTLTRPDILNALDARLCRRLREVVRTVDEDPDVDVVRLAGEGDAFCAGFDLNELADDLGGMNYESYERHADAIDDLQMISRIVRGSDTVFLAEVHGYAIGASCELALICDVAVTAVDAEFASRRRTSASLSRTG